MLYLPMTSKFWMILICCLYLTLILSINVDFIMWLHSFSTSTREMAIAGILQHLNVGNNCIPNIVMGTVISELYVKHWKSTLHGAIWVPNIIMGQRVGATQKMNIPFRDNLCTIRKIGHNVTATYHIQMNFEINTRERNSLKFNVVASRQIGS